MMRLGDGAAVELLNHTRSVTRINGHGRPFERGAKAFLAFTQFLRLEVFGDVFDTQQHQRERLPVAQPRCIEQHRAAAQTSNSGSTS